MSANHPNTEVDPPLKDDSERFQLPPRVFRLTVLVTLVGGGGFAAATYLSPFFMIAGALAVALIADGLEPFDTGWLGWRRRLDRTRVFLFVGWFVVALLGLSLVWFAVVNRIAP
jgi:hypothetical protein